MKSFTRELPIGTLYFNVKLQVCTLSESRMKYIYGKEGSEELIGGDGDDYISGGFGDSIVGGAGNDELHILASRDERWGIINVDAGPGNDTVWVGSHISSDLNAEIRVTGGTGADLYIVSTSPLQIITVKDFEVGPGGDRISVDHLFTSLGAPPQSHGNPFADGRLRLEQRGSDVWLLYNADGTGGSWLHTFALAVLQNVTLGSLTADNFAEVLPIDGSLVGIQLHGTDGDDYLKGGYVNDTIFGGYANDGLFGNGGDDHLNGGDGRDYLVGDAGNDVIEGGEGIDIAGYYYDRKNYTITRNGDSLTFVAKTGNEGTDFLHGVERAFFAISGYVAFDVDGIAGQVYRLYRAAFDRTPDDRGFGFWLKATEQGVEMQEVARNFVASEEFIALYGSSPTHTELVTRFYENVLDRAPESAGLEFWVQKLDSQQIALHDMLTYFSESAENQAAVAPIIGQGIDYVLWG